MLITVAALGLSLVGGLAPQDSEIEPLESDVVAVFLATPEASDLCAQIGDLSDMVGDLGAVLGSEASFIFDMAASYWQDMAEEGFGESAAMTVEAEDLFQAWVYDCAGRIQPTTP